MDDALPHGLHRRLALVGTPRRLHGFSHLTFAAESALLGRVVVKVSGAGPGAVALRREHRVLARVVGRTFPIPAPRPIELAAVDGWTALVMSRLPGRSGTENLGEMAPSAVAARAERLGRALAALHTLDRTRRGGTALDPVASRLPASVAALANRPWAGSAIGQATRRALEAPEWAGAEVWVHGDAGFHNTLWDGAILTGLVDWEWSGSGPALLDLAWVWWTFQFRRLPPAAFDAFTAGYGRDRLLESGWAADAVETLVLGRMAVFALESAHEAEWLGRAERVGAMVESFPFRGG